MRTLTILAALVTLCLVATRNVQSAASTREYLVSVISLEHNKRYPIREGEVFLRRVPRSTVIVKYAGFSIELPAGEQIGTVIGLETDRGIYLTRAITTEQRGTIQLFEAQLTQDPQLGVGYTTDQAIAKLKELLVTPRHPRPIRASWTVLEKTATAAGTWRIVIETKQPPPPSIAPGAELTVDILPTRPG